MGGSMGAVALDGIAIFVAVAETASFRGAAEALGVPRSTVSRKVAELERALGARLLLRSTRRVSLTEAGAAYLRACQPALGALGEAATVIRAGALEARGRLRITASVTFGERLLGPVIDEYLRENPHVEVDVMLADRQVDVLQEGFDFAFRAGAVGDSSLVARELARGPILCVASPGYLEGRPRPRRPADLARHDCIIYPLLTPQGRWSFRTRGRTVHVPVSGRLVVNSLPLALEAATRGRGIARVPSALVGKEIATGAVVELLKAHVAPASPLFLVYPVGSHTVPHRRAFLEVVVRRLVIP